MAITTIDPALNAELVQLYRELARATAEPVSPRSIAETLERWRASRDNIERIKMRIKEITEPANIRGA
jgi:hypothetical protein